MGNLQDSNHDAAVVADAATGPGHRLRVAREARQLTRDAVAVQLRVEPKVIDALERDDYAQLPAAVFVRGYLRAYSKLVGLTPESLIEIFDRLATHAPPPLILPTAIGPEMAARHGYARRIVIALVVLSLLLFYQWWRLESRTSPPVRMPPPVSFPQAAVPPPVQTVSEPVPVPTPAPGMPLESLYETPPDESGASVQTESQSTAQTTQTEATAGTDTAPVTTTAPTVVAPPVPSPAAPPQAAVSEAVTRVPSATTAPLVLRFNADCWVVIRDANGRVLLQDMIKSGTRHALEGKPPFELTLGNSPAVEIEYRGRHFDQSRYTGSSGTAHFTLGK